MSDRPVKEPKNPEQERRDMKHLLRQWSGIVRLRTVAHAECEDEKLIKAIEKFYQKAHHELKKECKKKENYDAGLNLDTVQRAKYDGGKGFERLDPKIKDIIDKNSSTVLEYIESRMNRFEKLKLRAKQAAIGIGTAAVLAGVIWVTSTFGGEDKTPPDIEPTTIVQQEDGDQQKYTVQQISIEEFVANYKAQTAEQLYNYIELTSFFEWTKGTVDERFGYVEQTDKMSVGIVCENPSASAQTMNTTTKRFIAAEPELAKEILGPYYKEYLEKVRYDAKNPRAVFDLLSSDKEFAARERAEAEAFQNWVGENYEELAPRIAKMYNHETGRKIQIENLNDRLKIAEDLCNEWELTTARSKQAMFDLIVKEGGSGFVKKLYGPIMYATKDLKIDNPDTLWDSYFRNLYKGKSLELISSIKEYYLSLSPEAQIDQYRLNLAYEDALEQKVRSENSATMKRQSVIIGRDYRFVIGKNGERVLEKGGQINGTYRATNDEVLDAPRSSVSSLLELLAAQNYYVSDEMLSDILHSQSESFRFTEQNIKPPKSQPEASTKAERER